MNNLHVSIKTASEKNEHRLTFDSAIGKRLFFSTWT